MIRKQNKDVPQEAIIKQLLIENGKLKSEVAFLESELESKNKAIAAFKEWQKNVADRNYLYWLNEAVNIMHERPSDKILGKIRSLVTDSYACKKMETQLERISKRIAKKERSGVLQDELNRVLGSTEQ